MNIIFVLIEPAVPENIGAVARALKTTGFKELRLVNPCSYKNGPAKWLAYGSNDILLNAKTYTSFNDSVKDIDLVIGTTAKQRNVKNDYCLSKDLPDLLSKKGNTIQKVAIVFGREESGLRNEELKKCHLVTTIPLKTSFPSLNLAQAVMIFAYELSKNEDKITTTNKTEEGLKVLITKIQNILQKIGFKKNTAIYPRFLERIIYLEENDIHLLHSFLNKLNDYMQHKE